MLAKVLHVTEYTKNGSSYKSQEIRDPSWQEIESAIRRLDKYCFPFIWIFLTSETDDLPDFQIVGGKGEYWMAFNIDGYDHRRFYNPNGNEDKEVWVWESDQGQYDDDRFICRDLEVVVKATKYFCEYGSFEPSISWEDQTRESE